MARLTCQVGMHEQHRIRTAKAKRTVYVASTGIKSMYTYGSDRQYSLTGTLCADASMTSRQGCAMAKPPPVSTFGGKIGTLNSTRSATG